MKKRICPLSFIIDKKLITKRMGGQVMHGCGNHGCNDSNYDTNYSWYNPCTSTDGYDSQYATCDVRKKYEKSIKIEEILK